MLRASGIGTYLQNILPTLCNIFDVILLGDANEIEPYAISKIAISLPIYSVSEIVHLPKRVPPCDIFWSPHYNVPLFSVPARKRLVTIHDTFHLAHLNTLSLKQKIYAQVMMKACVKKSDHIITVSEFSRSEIIKYTHAPPDKVTVIHNGVNHQQFNPTHSANKKQEVSDQYKLPENYILYVGNVKPHKNLICLIKAFSQIHNYTPHHLVIVGKKEGFITGDNELFATLEQRPQVSEKAHFTGFVADEDLPLIYSMADLFVFPSLYEGFGLPPLEAMACGCLTLTSNRASMPEICGEATTYFNPESPLELAEQIKRLLALPDAERQAMISQGSQKAGTYTWKNAIQKHVEIIQKLAYTISG
uniref:Glycosyltransferase family 1 protein n=1 Tax=Roseihalotalea indica TaxID=2867963 RepID=A0AA49Q0A9_9BACT|nr:glycosyltransferase family 1 protein [Tunicatimonas sp. TK19036]